MIGNVQTPSPSCVWRVVCAMHDVVILLVDYNIDVIYLSEGQDLELASPSSGFGHLANIPLPFFVQFLLRRIGTGGWAGSATSSISAVATTHFDVEECLVLG